MRPSTALPSGRPLAAALPILAGALLLLASLPITADAQLSAGAFTYQGQLKDGDTGVNASGARMNFRLWDAETSGHQIGSDFVIRPVEIVDGVFTVVVDFGEDVFADPNRWLEIGVDVTGGTDYTWMTPRQPITPAPMAVHALHGGDNPWTITGNDISFTSGKVGVGTTSPTSQLHVRDSNTEPVIKSVSVEHGEDSGIAIEGQVEGIRGSGVKGYAPNAEGTANGVYGEAHAPNGAAVKGLNYATTGNAVGVYGRSYSDDGYAGYFWGPGYFNGALGIGVPDPREMLEVDGTAVVTGFKLDASPQDGYVLTSDGFGNGTWQAPAASAGYWEDGAGSEIYYDAGYVGVGTNDPESPLHVEGASSDPILQAVANDDGTGNGTAIHAEVTAEDGYAVFGRATSTSGQVMGIYGSVQSPAGHGVYGYNGHASGGGSGVFGKATGEQSAGLLGIHDATTGYGKAVFGRSDSPDGFGGYFMGKGYFSGDVGVGTTSPSTELDVVGTVKMEGLQLSTSPQEGYVLTSDASGNGTWQAAASGLWEPGDSGKIYYNGGNVGIGVTNPQSALDVQGAVESDSIYTNAIDAYSLKLRHSPQAGHVLTSDADGNATWQAATCAWEDGTGDNIHYDNGNVGIGTAYPSARLDVLGTVKADGIKLVTSPAAGYVLTSDASGNGSWQPPGGLTLPYDGATSSSSAAFHVTNSGSSAASHAISGRIDNSNGSSDAAAGYFDARDSDGHAVAAFSDHTSAIHAYNDGSGSAIYAHNNSDAPAGHFTSSGFGGHALDARASGEQAYALHAEATGGGAAIVAEATGSSTIGIVAHGSSTAGKFYGNVAIYEHGTTTKVLELGKGLDYAEGFDVTGGRQAACAGCVMVIDPQSPGQLTLCTQAYDRKVAGIVAGAKGLGSGVRLGAGEFDHDVALAGRVYCNVIAADQDIQPGDMLTTSSVPGYAMEVTEPTRAHGAVLGKAMEPLAKGEKGQILVLVTLQ
ncbi:MAG: hypothetical protein GF330_08965 [Candidatus Eisenbacteria bacterium]|nr:hypothetical protein [Candidatus Eisenbacteria bacterium]